jgi:ribosome-associated toxin RatA of RatAB toxin-antitoxin module
MADRTESSIVVDARPADVLAVIADFGSYPEWTGAVKETQVLDAGTNGRADRVRFVLDAGAIKDTYVLSYTWAIGRSGTGSVSWTLDEAQQLLKALDGSYTLDGPAAGPTTVTYQLAVDVKIPMLGMLKRKAEKSIIDTALKELKKRVEG